MGYHLDSFLCGMFERIYFLFKKVLWKDWILKTEIKKKARITKLHKIEIINVILETELYIQSLNL